MTQFSKGAALDDLQRRFGGILREREEPATVGVAAARILGRDGERVSVTFVNLSANIIYVAPFATVSSTRAIRLAPSGGLMSINVTEDATLPCVEWHAVAAGAGSTLYIITIKRDAVQAPEAA